ncbi:MAG: FAD-binding oxidoreductase [Armatimonadetes bacterium]|nr:FAD-binding oxidoreductase [Armatimonadota bacterium]
MTIHPTSIEELADALHSAAASGKQISGWELSSLPRSIVHHASDLTVTLTSNVHLAELQSKLAPHRQWLPIDPLSEISPTIEQILSSNLSGPRRYGFGTIREHILGVTVMLANGRVIHSGGQVVKNVAGFDLCKLFIGSRGNLGIILEATFKLRPFPESEKLFACQCSSLSEADAVINTLISAPIAPVILDLHNLSSSNHWQIVIGLAGATEDVAWQAAILQSVGEFKASNDHYLDAAIRQIPNINATHSVLPSQLCQVLALLPKGPVLVHAGNGIIRNGTTDTVPVASSVSGLLKRLKSEFDPVDIFGRL